MRESIVILSTKKGGQNWKEKFLLKKYQLIGVENGIIRKSPFSKHQCNNWLRQVSPLDTVTE